VRSQGASSAEAGREAGAQGPQSWRQERLDGRLLRTPRTRAMAGGRDGQREELKEGGDHPSGTPGKNGPAIIAFLCPKPPLGSLTKAIGLGSTMPSWRSGSTHGFCITGGHSPIASEPTPSLRLWAAAPGATPGTADRTYHGWSQRPLKTGTFYFARKRNFLLCLDKSIFPDLADFSPRARYAM
jgi:hypothetical protein